MRTLFFLLSIISFSQSAFSQSGNLNITGILVDRDNSPVDYATITLLSSDSLYIRGANLLADGTFDISDIVSGDYLLKIQSLGYNDMYVSIPQMNKKMNIGTISLTENSEILNEVVVTADAVINKVNKQILLPSSLQLKTSTQGFDLLNKMPIPDIRVDVVNRVISSADGGNVQLRINGVRSEINELMSLKAENILRVESYNALDARFGNEDASVIIDVILKERRTGGYVMADLTNALFTGFGNHQVASRMNYKDSEFGISYDLSYRDYEDRWIDKTTTFNIPDNTIIRRQYGIRTPFNYQVHTINLLYNLLSKDKYTLNILLKNELWDANNDYRSKNYYINNNASSLSTTFNSLHSNKPVLDVFFKYNLPNEQSLAFNMVGTYIRTDNDRLYMESNEIENLTDIHNKIKGDKYSLISELIYDRKIQNQLFTAGAKHTQGYANNKYTGSSIGEVDLKNTDTYVFAQIQGSIKKIGYSFGLGLTRLWFQQEDEGYTFYSLRPSAQLSYKIRDNLTVKYAFSVISRAPSLSQLSDIVQQVDSLVSTTGNSALKPYNVYNNNFIFSYHKGVVNASLNLRYTYYNRPIMDNIYVEDDKLLVIPDNQRRFQRLGGFLNVNVELIKNIWSIGLTGGIDYYQSNGQSYSHSYTNHWGDIETNIAYKKFDLNMGIYLRTNQLWGETINYGEDWQSIDLGYTHNSFKFGVGMSYPFKNKWSAGSKSLSDLKPETSWTYIADNGHMLYLKFAWNFSFGKKAHTSKKTLNNIDSDTGIKSLD
ncbi:TonB-dependent receptor [Dysgonomonas sp. HDW5B]|uniref:outer membrane beta-barrel protein n=1 Tax=Dysgonomonas sp. HDW5B TaxID=2714927 RepID=UPI00140B6A32|nr:outer membrane beta-barrel protein [Dysgonomonas sp. HDW5B]QIK53628.1 TonB-dependent receptor [Dysgonomonas sp. HDW5B]